MGVPTERRAESNAVFWLLFAIFALIALIHFRTAASIVSIWQRSNTFGHGFLIPPIVAWLIWRRRDQIRAVPIRPAFAWLAAVAFLGFAWFWGTLAGVLILEQFAFALLIPATVAALLGTAMFRALLFPLGFLLLGVPAGDAIAGPLIEFTARFAVKALQISGIPVVREGPYLTIPNGVWVVTDACSGFRYLMASLTLGSLYAYLQFRTWRYRLLFISLSLAVPIFANGVRAYLIVLLGYLSDSKLAVGVDHYIYGWVLFAVFCVFLLWIGSRLREPAVVASPAAAPLTTPPARLSLGRIAPVGLLAVLCLGIWPVLAARVGALAPSGPPPSLELPAAIGAWSATDDSIAEWRPAYHGATVETGRAYRRGDRTIALFIGYYRHQRQGSELINSTNEIITLDKHAEWRRGWERERVVSLPQGDERFWETDASKPGRRLLLWHRFWSGGEYTTNPLVAEVLALRQRMQRGRDDAALVVLLAPYAAASSLPEATATLADFYAIAGPSLDSLLVAAAKLP
jgi:exosortase A